MNQQVDQRAQDLRRRDDSAHAAAGPVLVTAGDAASLPPRRWDAIKGDLAGGATSGIVALPQTITIGALAFAPLGPGYVTYGILAGFYCSIVSGLLVALCGGTRFGVGGPRSSFSLVMALILSALLAHETGLAGAGVARVLVLTFLAVSLAGLLQIAFGAIGAGSYIKFIPHPVVAGFMNGLALLILVSQLPALAGIARDTRWWDFQTILDQLQFATAAVALMTFLIMSSVGRTWPRLPAALIAVAGGTAFYYALSYYPAASRFGVPHLGALVGTIPASFPAPAFLGKFVAAAGEKQTWYLLWQIAPSIAVLALLGALESLMCAVAVGQLSGRRPEANRELIAQGVSNLAGGVFGAVFGGSTSSRTMLNYRAGGRGRLSGVTHAGVMLLALMTAQFWVAHLPQVVLAAVLTTIALGMFDGWTRDIIKRMRQPNVHREVYTNFAIVVLVTVATVAFNLLAGVLAGVIATVVVFLGKSSQSVVRAVHRGDKRHSLKLRSPEKTAHLRAHGARIVIIELERTLFFGTADSVSLLVEQIAPGADFVIFDFRRVTEIDATGAHLLEQTGARLAKQGKIAVLGGVTMHDANGQFLAGMGVAAGIAQTCWFADTDYALEWCESQLLARAFDDDETSQELSIAQLGIAADCDAAEVALLAQHLERRVFEAGEYLFREGDAGDTLYVPARGSISIKLPRQGNTESRRLVTLSPGVMFGEMVLVEDRPRSADAVAEEYAVVYGLTRAVLDTLRAQYPALAGKLLLNMSRLLADRLRTTTEELRAAAA